MKPRQAKANPVTLARLRAGLDKHGITLTRVAEEATKTSRRGSVGITTVSHVLAGRRPSSNVVATVKRLLAEARATAQADAKAKECAA